MLLILLCILLFTTLITAACDAKSCGDCTGDKACIWCNKDNTCLPGDSTGPSGSGKCTDGDFSWEQCIINEGILVLIILGSILLCILVTWCYCRGVRKRRLKKRTDRLLAEWEEEDDNQTQADTSKSQGQREAMEEKYGHLMSSTSADNTSI